MAANGEALYTRALERGWEGLIARVNAHAGVSARLTWKDVDSGVHATHHPRREPARGHGLMVVAHSSLVVRPAVVSGFSRTDTSA